MRNVAPVSQTSTTLQCLAVTGVRSEGLSLHIVAVHCTGASGALLCATQRCAVLHFLTLY